MDFLRNLREMNGLCRSQDRWRGETVNMIASENLLSPAVRVTSGLIAGIALLVTGDFARRRAGGFPYVANALAGAGLVCLYAATWAARNLCLASSRPE